MGYRSEVAMLIVGSGVPALIANARLTGFGKDAKVVDECIGELRIWPDRIELYADGWEWYDSYQDVQWFESLWSEAEALGQTGVDISGRFVRIGEDANDIDERAFGDAALWDELEIHRAIDFHRREAA